MKQLRYVMVLWVAMISACAVMPATVAEQAVKIPYLDLIGLGEAGVGQTAIVGGYVLKVENFKDHTRIEAVQAPLSFDQKPKNKDMSEGRLILTYPGFLDPEVYTQDRKITLGGKILGSSSTEQDDDKPYPYIRLQIESIHLWPVEVPIVYYEPDPLMFDPWFYPYPWRRFPYRHH